MTNDLKHMVVNTLKIKEASSSALGKLLLTEESVITCNQLSGWAVNDDCSTTYLQVFQKYQDMNVDILNYASK